MKFEVGKKYHALDGQVYPCVFSGLLQGILENQFGVLFVVNHDEKYWEETPLLLLSMI